MYAKVLKDAAASTKAWLSRNRGVVPVADAVRSLFGRLSQPDGGFTYSAKTNSEPKEGYALSPYPEHSFAKKASEMSSEDVMDYILSKADLLKDPKHHVGAWHDPATGTAYMDISVVVKTPKEAHALCKKHDQIAYFDIKKMQSVTVDQNATSGGVAKGDSMKTENELVVMSGEGAMTVEGMERLYKALSGKDFTPAERVTAQKKIDAQAAKAKKSDE